MTTIWSKTNAQKSSLARPDSGDQNESIQVIIEVALDRVALLKSRPPGSTTTYRRATPSGKDLTARQQERQAKLEELKRALAEIAPDTRLKEIKSGNAVAATLSTNQIEQLIKLPCVRAIRRVVSHRL